MFIFSDQFDYVNFYIVFNEDLPVEMCKLFKPMKSGKVEGVPLIPPLQESKWLRGTKERKTMILIIFSFACTQSYLRSLVPKFISVVQEDLIDVLKAKADGRTVVDMKDAFANTTLQVLSRVS